MIRKLSLILFIMPLHAMEIFHNPENQKKQENIELQEKLAVAINHRDNLAVKSLIAQGADVNGWVPFYESAFEHVILYHRSLCAIFLQAGANPNIRIKTPKQSVLKKEEWTPLIEAARRSDMQCILLLFEYGARLNEILPSGLTVLAQALKDAEENLAFNKQFLGRPSLPWCNGNDGRKLEKEQKKLIEKVAIQKNIVLFLRGLASPINEAQKMHENKGD